MTELDNDQIDQTNETDETKETNQAGETNRTNQIDQPCSRLGILELVYGTLFNPVTTFKKVAVNPPLFYSFIIFIAVVVLKSLADTVLPRGFEGMPPELSHALAQAGPVLTVIGALVSVLLWFFQAGILQVISELIGGQGRGLGTLTVLALSALPGILTIPLKVGSYFLSGSFGGASLSAAGPLLAGVWGFILLVIGLREIQHLSTGRALAVVAVPIAALIAFFIVLGISLLVFVAPFLGQGAL